MAIVAFQCALDVEKHRLTDRSTRENTKVLQKIAKRVRMVRVMPGEDVFNGTQTIKIILLFMNFCMVCNNADICWSAVVLILLYFLHKTSKIFYEARSRSLEDKSQHRRANDYRVTSYPEEVHYFLGTYDTRDLIIGVILPCHAFVKTKAPPSSMLMS